MKTPEMPRYVSMPGPNLNAPYQELYGEPVKAPDVLSSEEKSKLLRADLKKLEALFTENGISLPQNLLDRIKFLGALSYYEFRKKSLRGAKENYDTLGFSINDNALGYISIFDCEWDAKHSGISAEESLRRTSVHELLHCLSVKEWWMSTNPDDHNYIINRREGIATSRPVPDSKGNAKYIGGRRLNEGIVTYLTQQITNVDTPENLKRFYPGETEIVGYLVKQIGLEPLLKTMFTKRGLRGLNAKMTKAFGSKSLREMLEYIGVEYVDNEVKNKEKTEGKLELYYPRTLEYLRLTSSLTSSMNLLRMLEQHNSNDVAENFQK